MRVIDVARTFRVSADWLRQLERTGKIPPPSRDLNGYRRYSEEDLARIREVLFKPRSSAEPPKGHSKARGGIRGAFVADDPA